MAYHVTTQFGAMERNPSQERMAAVIDSIDPNDEEHPDVSLTHESEWCIGVFASGLVTFENLESGEPMHMSGLGRQEILDLWQTLARGEIDALRALRGSRATAAQQRDNQALQRTPRGLLTRPHDRQNGFAQGVRQTRPGSNNTNQVGSDRGRFTRNRCAFRCALIGDCSFIRGIRASSNPSQSALARNAVLFVIIVRSGGVAGAAGPVYVGQFDLGHECDPG